MLYPLSVSASRPPPKIQAMVLCDQVYVDAGTGKFVIAGTFTGFLSSSFPARHRTWFLYLSFYDFDWEEEYFLQVVSLKDHRQVAKSERFRVRGPGRNRVYEMAIAMPPAEFDGPGAFVVELVRTADDSPMSSCRFSVVDARQRETTE